MIVYVHFEHARLRKQRDLWRYFATKALETKYCIETICKEDCLIIRYDRLAPDLLPRLKPKAVVFSGNYSGFQHFAPKDLDMMRALFRTPICPTLCICGSFQLLAQTYGAQIGPIALQDASSGSPVADTDTPMPPDLYLEGVDSRSRDQDTRWERGFKSIHVLQQHPLFEDLPAKPVVFQLHGGEVKTDPKDFEVLATSRLCPVQVIAHKHLPLIGTQFHPEVHNKAYPAGGQLLSNFFRLAGFAIP